MAKLFEQIKNATSRFLDPDRERRVGVAAAALEAEISRVRGPIDVGGLAARLGCQSGEITESTQRAYQAFLLRAWKDGKIDDKERKTLAQIGLWLGLSAADILKADEKAAVQAFELALDQAMQDGRIDDAEAARLSLIAASVQHTTGTLVRQFFSARGEGFLRNAFLRSISDGRLSEAEWATLASTALGWDCRRPISSRRSRRRRSDSWNRCSPAPSRTAR